MYAGRGLPLVSAMLTIWNQITTNGRSVYGSYVIEGAMLTVKTPRGKKATQLGNSNSHFLAEWLFA
jgi:hypothetical protein